MVKKIMSMSIASIALLCIAFGPLSVSADSNYNATVQPGKAVKLAEEPIWLGTTVQGTQSKVFSSGNIGVQYSVQDNSGNPIDSRIIYGDHPVDLEFDTKALGETLSLWAKNLYNSALDTVKLVGTWFD